jgi:hypothetical protein
VNCPHQDMHLTSLTFNNSCPVQSDGYDESRYFSSSFPFSSSSHLPSFSAVHFRVMQRNYLLAGIIQVLFVFRFIDSIKVNIFLFPFLLILWRIRLFLSWCFLRCATNLLICEIMGLETRQDWSGRMRLRKM